MKKKLKIALMSLVLIPCLLLLTACSQAISVKDYNLKVKQSAEAFYENYEKKDLVVTFNSTTTEKTEDYISYKTSATEDGAGTYESTTTTEITQTVTLDSTMAEGANVMNASIVKYEKVTEKGWEQNADKTAVVETNKVTETTTTQTFIDDVESRKVYTVIEVKVDGVVDTTKAVKEVHSFVSSDAYYGYISQIATKLDSEFFSQFYMESDTKAEISLLYGCEFEYFKDGKKFGYSGEFNAPNVSKTHVSFVNGEFKAVFGKDSLPMTAKMNFENEYKMLNADLKPNLDNSVMTKSTSVMNSECEVAYEASLTAPTATDFATALDIESVRIDGMDF